jgi:hypothetical protein
MPDKGGSGLVSAERHQGRDREIGDIKSERGQLQHN